MTREELLKRKNFIGASEVPAILGTSPYMTRTEVWEDKINPEVVEKEDNEQMALGRKLEPEARKMFVAILPKLGEVEEELPARECLHPEYPFMRASLDCANKEGPVRIFAEIKCQWDKDWELGEVVPPKYEYQVQAQFLVSGCNNGYFVGIHHKTKEFKVFKVLPDPLKMKLILDECIHFWWCVQTKTKPDLTHQDYKVVKNEEAEMLTRAYFKFGEAIAALEKKREEAKERLISFCDHPRVMIDGVKFVNVVRKGSIPYSSIPEIQKMDLESYRSKPTSYWKIGE